MPRTADHGTIYWAAGFPNHTKGAPWTRIIETGYYTLAINTETLEISQLGGQDSPADKENETKDQQL